MANNSAFNYNQYLKAQLQQLKQNLDENLQQQTSLRAPQSQYASQPQYYQQTNYNQQLTSQNYGGYSNFMIDQYRAHYMQTPFQQSQNISNFQSPLSTQQTPIQYENSQYQYPYQQINYGHSHQLAPQRPPNVSSAYQNPYNHLNQSSMHLTSMSPGLRQKPIAASRRPENGRKTDFHIDRNKRESNKDDLKVVCNFEITTDEEADKCDKIVERLTNSIVKYGMRNLPESARQSLELKMKSLENS